MRHVAITVLLFRRVSIWNYAWDNVRNIGGNDSPLWLSWPRTKGERFSVEVNIIMPFFFFFAEDRLDFKFSLYDAVVWLFITLYDDVE